MPNILQEVGAAPRPKFIFLYTPLPVNRFRTCRADARRVGTAACKSAWLALRVARRRHAQLACVGRSAKASAGLPRRRTRIINHFRICAFAGRVGTAACKSAWLAPLLRAPWRVARRRHAGKANARISWTICQGQRAAGPRS